MLSVNQYTLLLYWSTEHINCYTSDRAVEFAHVVDSNLLLFLHKDIQLQVDKVVDTFVRRKPQRLLLVNPMADV